MKAWPLGIGVGLTLLMAVDGVMVYIASQNPPVMDSDNYYAESLTYEEDLKAQRASAALGWQAQVTVSPDAVQYALTYADGRPVTGLKGALRFRRADTTAFDGTSALVEGAPGQYQAARGERRGAFFQLEARLLGGPAPYLDRRPLHLP